MADPQDLSSFHAAPMHSHDRRLLAIFNWAGNIGGALTVGCYVAWAIDQMPLHLAAPGMAVGLLAMTGATIYAFRERAPTKRSYFWPITFGAIALTWAVLGWQTWMWFHPSTQAVQGYTQAQLEDAKVKAAETATRPIQEKLDQANNDNAALRQSNAKQIADAVAKATAQSQAQSDTSVSVDKVPTSMRLLFKGNSAEEIEAKNVAGWTPLELGSAQQPLLGSRPLLFGIVIVFKKPIAFKGVRIDDHGTGIVGDALITDPYFVVVEFGGLYLSGLVDIVVTSSK
jgi:hypothetical protein